ncbi:MAG: hypothetical protein ACRCYO_13420 [Bacteroidia bacterium]
MKAFNVEYTKKVGGTGTIMVKAIDKENALRTAKFLCFMGSEFRNPVEVSITGYVKPRKQGFAGSHRQ